MANDLTYENVSMRFAGRAGTVEALAPFDCRIDGSEFLVIVGPSGCGKSTLLHLTAGLYRPPTGRILLGGEEVREPGPDKAIVFQNFSLFPWKTVAGNIDFGLRINGMAPAERAEQIRRIIRLIGLEGFENHYPRQLSGGMQQRVAIARSFVLKPRVLLMDEPFAALDAQNRQLMQEELVRIWSTERPTVMFITHSVEEAVFLADRVIVMTRRPGRIKDVLDVRRHTGGQHWRSAPYDDVIRRSDFQELRTHIWRLVKEEIDTGRRH